MDPSPLFIFNETFAEDKSLPRHSSASGSETEIDLHVRDGTDIGHDPNYWAMILLVLCVFVVFGNVLVILSVCRERLLQNMTNFFIVSLAVADLLVAGFVMPFSVYVLVNWGMWNLPKIICDFYISSDVICSTSSIFNLVAISVDRYLAVTTPIKYSQHKDQRERAYVCILVCWVSSIAIGMPIMLGANPIPNSNDPLSLNLTTEANSTMTTAPSKWDMVDQSSSAAAKTNGSSLAAGPEEKAGNKQDEGFVCAFYNPDFIIYSSLGSFYIPCIVMVFIYVRIFKALSKRAKMTKKKVMNKSSYPLLPNPKVTAKAIGKPSEAPNNPIGETRLNDSPSRVMNKDPAAFAQDCQDHELGGGQQPSSAGKQASKRPNNETNCCQLPSSASPISPPPLKPNMAHKACGPDSNFYERSKSVQKQAAGPGSAGGEGHDDHKVVVHAEVAAVEVAQSSSQEVSAEGDHRCFKHGWRCLYKLRPPSSPRANVSVNPAGQQQQQHCLQPAEEAMLVQAPTSAQGRGVIQNQVLAALKKKDKRFNKKKRDKSTARKERKATKTLAIVLGCFLVCWTPFFTCNIINAICIKFELGWYPGDIAFILTTWLGYVNSCINPLIYTIFNPEFRKAFKKILGLGH